MDTMTWGVAAPAVAAAFFASVVEIVVAVGTLRGWRPAALGTIAALAALAGMILLLGPLLDHIPLHLLQLVIGILLLLFGMGWLRKAALRHAGVMAMHDEDAIFAEESAQLRRETAARPEAQDWIAGLACFKAVLEGVEVVFIVIAVGAGGDLLWPAALGATLACALVLLAGIALHKPLSRVPENALKFGVGVMLSAFGVYWTGAGLGIDWPGHDFALLVFAALFLGVGLAAAAQARRA
jgi:uncharacterized membrane protein